MVDRASLLAPPDLRITLVENLQALAGLDTAKFPEGARASVYSGFNSFQAYGLGGGNMEWLYTREQPKTPLTFAAGSTGIQQTPSGNCILAKDGNLWIRVPGVYLVTLNGVTPVVLDDVANQLGTGLISASNVIAAHSRQSPGASTGHIVVTAGNAPGNENQLNVVSTDAGDNGQIRLLVWPFFTTSN